LIVKYCCSSHHKQLFLIPCCIGTETEEEIFEEVLHGDLDFTSDPWPNISEGAKDLVRRMLIRDPKKRLTAHEVLCKCYRSYLYLSCAPFTEIDLPIKCSKYSNIDSSGQMSGITLSRLGLNSGALTCC